MRLQDRDFCGRRHCTQTVAAATRYVLAAAQRPAHGVSGSPSSVSRDRWAEWLAERRFGGDTELRERWLTRLIETRERILDAAAFQAGESLLDVGCGEGLVGFGALERGAGLVVFSDISTDLLEVCRGLATELGVLERCRFVEGSATDLSEIKSGLVDVVATRSVLIYVRDKGAAFAEFHRVLRPGGRISLWEPINQFAQTNEPRWVGYDVSPVREIAAKLHARSRSLHPGESDPMLDFDERDLFRVAEEAGFYPINLSYEAGANPTEPRSWEGFLNSSGNPNLPTHAQTLEQALTPSEREQLSAHLKPLVENGQGVWRMAFAHLTATKR